MHRRSVSSSAAEGHAVLGQLQHKRGGIHGATARTYTNNAAPPRSRAKPESAAAPLCLPPSGKTLSEDHIVCQSKLYDAFELQELEQHLDRRLNLPNDPKSRSISSQINGQESLNSKHFPLSVPNFLDDRPSTADQLRGRAICACNSCTSEVKGSSTSSLISASSQPSTCTQSLVTVSNIAMEPAQMEAEAGCSCNEPRAQMNYPLHKENDASLARRSFSLPRSYHHSRPAGPAFLDVEEEEALQEVQLGYADEKAVPTTSNALKADKERRAKSSRWPLVDSLFRSLTGKRKKQNNMLIMKENASSPSISQNVSRQQWNSEYHHHHNIVHYHHVYHHHHHHVMNGGHFEEIDWPLSPTHLSKG